MTPRISVIIPVHNKAEFTEQCLLALSGSLTHEPAYEVIVVDNASTDWTGYLLQYFQKQGEHHCPPVRVKRLQENLGFAKACNIGAQAAQADVLVFLNNDTIPHAGWLQYLWTVMEDETVGIVGAKLLYPDSGWIQHAGIVASLHPKDGLLQHIHRGVKADDPLVNQQIDLDMVTGACLMIRAQLFGDLGGFDVGYQNGCEDVDLCLQVRDAGLRVVYCPKSVLGHYEGQTAGRYDCVARNLERFQEKWSGRFDHRGHFISANEKIEEEVLP